MIKGKEHGFYFVGGWGKGKEHGLGQDFMDEHGFYFENILWVVLECIYFYKVGFGFVNYSRTAFILLTPAEDDCSFVILNVPSSEVLMT